MKKNNLKRYHPLFLSLIFCLITLNFCVQAWAERGKRPGADNPLKVTKRILFQDDELLLMVGNPAAQKMTYSSMAPDNNQLDSWTSSAKSHDYLESEYSIDDNGWPYPAIKSCRGRFTRSDIEQVAYLIPQADSEHIILEVWDIKDGRHSLMTTFPVSKLYSRPDIFDITAADIDEVADDKGNFHDEIIIARYGNDKTIIDILKYNNKNNTLTTISTIEYCLP